MTTRVLAWIATAATGAVLLCAGLVTTVLFGDGGSASASCYLPASAGPSPPATARSPVPAGVGPIGTWSSDQVVNAATIVTVGMRLGVPPHGWVIAVATAMQESSLINTPGGDQDSIGLFQQRPSQGWGTPAQLHDPVYAATKFYEKLQTVAGWQAMPLTEAAQVVQRSAYPDAYAKWEPDAVHLVAALTGLTAGLGACGASISAQGWTPPVHGTVGSGFRTSQRPGHDGVDLIVGKGTPVHAAAAGTVTTVRCNAVAADGSDYGCDHDGSPEIAGCGWYVDIDHPGGVVTRYCHLLARPAVAEGQHVAAGDVIGSSGSSGNSSGPHLHFEVHVRREALNDRKEVYEPVDPVAFLAQRGVKLGAA